MIIEKLICFYVNYFIEWKSYNDSWMPKVLIGDVRKVIPLLPNNYVDCVVTSGL